MREHGPVRRKRHDADEDTEAQAPLRAVPAEAMLALQRTAGNRAVVQRLAYDELDGTLTVPTAYSSQKLAWDGSYVPDDPKPAHQKTFYEHFNASREFKAAVEQGLGLGYIGRLAPSADQAIRTATSKWVKADLGDDELYAKLVAEAGAAGVSHNQVIAEPEEKFASADQVSGARRAVLRPQDFLPEVPDLPGEGVDLLKTKIPGDPEKNTYFTYACVLIALLKDGGFAKAKEITSAKTFPTDLHKAVQALHSHYVKKGVQYDDGAARNGIMAAWGYKLLWGGETSWEGLAAQLALPAGSYVFDITGHTVKVDVLKAVALGDKIADAKAVFRPESDGKNYTKNKEWQQKVLAVWKKG